MTNIPTLTHTILRQQPIEKLYEMYKLSNIINIEREIERRLVSCDYTINLPVINFIHKNSNDPIVRDRWLKSIYIIQGINASMECIPWKIGVIYNYLDQSYRTDKVSIIIGKSTAFKTKNGRYYKANWLHADDTKLTLREVISRNNRPINNVMSVVTHDLKLDNGIRKALVNNDTVTITVCLFLPPIGSSFHSFPDKSPLPHSERKEMYPCHITAGNFSHKLIDYGGNLVLHNPHEYHIKVTKSEDFKKLAEIIKLIN